MYKLKITGVELPTKTWWQKLLMAFFNWLPERFQYKTNKYRTNHYYFTLHKDNKYVQGYETIKNKDMKYFPKTVLKRRKKYIREQYSIKLTEEQFNICQSYLEDKMSMPHPSTLQYTKAVLFGVLIADSFGSAWNKEGKLEMSKTGETAMACQAMLLCLLDNLGYDVGPMPIDEELSFAKNTNTTEILERLAESESTITQKRLG